MAAVRVATEGVGFGKEGLLVSAFAMPWAVVMNAATLSVERLRETMVRWVLLMVVDMMSGLFRRMNG